MFNPMFSIVHKPLFVGSYLRNTGCGNRIMVVTSIIGDVITAMSYGNTNKGNFKLSKRHKVITGTSTRCGGLGRPKCKCLFVTNGKPPYGQGWYYTHVVRN